jgi:hypothetical protein
MPSEEELISSGLIKAELWLTPMQARVVQAVVAAMRQHAAEGHMPNELQALRAMLAMNKPE